MPWPLLTFHLCYAGNKEFRGLHIVSIKDVNVHPPVIPREANVWPPNEPYEDESNWTRLRGIFCPLSAW